MILVFHYALSSSTFMSFYNYIDTDRKVVDADTSKRVVITNT